MPKKFQTLLLENYRRIQPHIANYNHFPLEELKNKQVFLPILKASFTKCFEYNFDINKLRDSRYSFYFMSFLRGICEDLISLKFLLNFKIEDRNRLMMIYNQYLLHTSIQSQVILFDKVKIIQPILRLNEKREYVRI